MQTTYSSFRCVYLCCKCSFALFFISCCNLLYLRTQNNRTSKTKQKNTPNCQQLQQFLLFFVQFVICYMKIHKEILHLIVVSVVNIHRRLEVHFICIRKLKLCEVFARLGTCVVCILYSWYTSYTWLNCQLMLLVWRSASEHIKYPHFLSFLYFLVRLQVYIVSSLSTTFVCYFYPKGYLQCKRFSFCVRFCIQFFKAFGASSYIV